MRATGTKLHYKTSEILSEGNYHVTLSPVLQR